MTTASRLTGLSRLARLSAATADRGQELTAIGERFAAYRDPASAPTVVSSFNLFQTPSPIADRMAGMLRTGGRTLEPSAGLGRLYRAVRLRFDSSLVVLVDQSADCCSELARQAEGDDQARVVCADFLTTTAEELGGPFDAIVMNPPFKQGADVQHILHARRMLAAGGQLVALCANGPRQKANLRPLAVSWELLPANSFAAEGTRVEVAIIELEG